MLNRLQNPPRPQSRFYRSAVSSRAASSSRDTRPASKDEPKGRKATLARKMCVVEFRSGEAVVRHPELKCFLDAGWLIESAVPRLAEAQQVELLVVLTKGGDQSDVPAEEEDRQGNFS